MEPLSEDEKRDVLLILSVGCDRATAASYVGRRPDELETAARSDAEFDAAIRRSEAGCELAHMRNVQQAARDERHWRASVWWLERRLPERYAKREADAVGRRELMRFVSAAAAAIATAVQDEGDRHRVLERLSGLAEKLDLPRLWNSLPSHATPEQENDLPRSRDAEAADG